MILRDAFSPMVPIHSERLKAKRLLRMRAVLKRSI